MDFLRSLFGMFTSSVLRLAVSVGILAAAYFFIVKPVLHTTDNAINSANQQFAAPGFQVTPEIQRAINQVNRQVRRQYNRSIHQKLPLTKRQKRALRCVLRAHGNENRIQRCTRRF